MNQCVLIICGIILTGKNGSTWRKICPSAAFSTTDLRLTGLRSNPSLRRDGPEPWHSLYYWVTYCVKWIAIPFQGSTAITFHSTVVWKWLTCYLHTYLLTPWCRVLLEKLNDYQLVKKFPAFYETRRFITAFTSARHLYLSWASSIQSRPPHIPLPEDPF